MYVCINILSSWLNFKKVHKKKTILFRFQCLLVNPKAGTLTEVSKKFKLQKNDRKKLKSIRVMNVGRRHKTASCLYVYGRPCAKMAARSCRMCEESLSLDVAISNCALIQ